MISGDNKPVVAHLIRSYLAPTETFIYNQIRCLKSFKPIIVCHNRNKNSPYAICDTFSALEMLKGYQKIFANYFYKLLRQSTPMECEILKRTILENKSKLLHFHYAVDARYFLNLNKRLNIPSIVSLYGYDVSSFPKLYFGYAKFYLQPIFEKMDRFLAMSKDMKKDLILLGCPEKKIIIHYYGIEVDRFAFPERRYEEKETVNILMAGTLEVKKAQHLVLKALKKIENELKNDFTVTIVGDGPMKKGLYRMVKEYGWFTRVKFLGFIPYGSKEMIAAYRNADIFALPSITVRGDKEGIPGTIVEAMASGLPVVSSYHAGIPEVIENYREGILVSEGDIDGLVVALKLLIENRNLREDLGRKAAQRAVKEFDAKEKIKALEKIYGSLI